MLNQFILQNYRLFKNEILYCKNRIFLDRKNIPNYENSMNDRKKITLAITPHLI